MIDRGRNEWRRRTSCLSILRRISIYAGLRGFSPLLNVKKEWKDICAAKRYCIPDKQRGTEGRNLEMNNPARGWKPTPSSFPLRSFPIWKWITPRGDGNLLAVTSILINQLTIWKWITPRGDGNFTDFSHAYISFSLIWKWITPQGDGNCNHLSFVTLSFSEFGNEKPREGMRISANMERLVERYMKNWIYAQKRGKINHQLLTTKYWEKERTLKTERGILWFFKVLFLIADSQKILCSTVNLWWH